MGKRQKRFSNRPCCATTEHVAPTALPRGLSTFAKRSVARICSGQRGQELASFGWPASTHFAAEDNKTTSSVFPRQLRVCSDFAFHRINECCPILRGCPCPEGPVPLGGTHESRVCGTLRDPENREAICYDFQSSARRNPANPCRGRLFWHLATFSIARRRVDGHTCSSVVTKGSGGEDGRRNHHSMGNNLSVELRFADGESHPCMRLSVIRDTLEFDLTWFSWSEKKLRKIICIFCLEELHWWKKRN